MANLIDTTINGNLTVTSSTEATSTATGAVRIYGGLGVAGDIWSTKYNDLTLTAGSTSFTIAGGTSRTLTIGTNLTTSAGAITLTGNAAGSSVTLPASGTLATTGNLSQFASTTSAQLAGVISDETGSGNLVFASSPTITTPTIAQINGSTATSGTLLLQSTSNATKGEVTITGSGVTLSHLTTAGPLITSNAGAVTSEQHLDVTRGGTGVGTFTSYGILYGNGTADIAATPAGAAGEYLKSNATSEPTWATFATATFTATSNRTSVADKTYDPSSASTIYIYEPDQDLNIASSPSFNTVTANLTGNVTGNVSGSSGSCTGNAATATTADKVANTLTLSTSGTGLSGSTTFNGSAAETFTVTSNATSANTASTIVARDASKNFSAGTITAALAGNASTASKWATARTISLTGAVTGSVSIDGSGNVSLATTATSDPTLTLSGDCSGSATFTNLGNATLSVVVANDSHTHDTRYYTESEITTKLAGKANSSHSHSYLPLSGGTITGTLTLGTPSKKANGYTLLPNGILLQWMSISTSSDMVGKAITFPIAFDTYCAWVGVSSDWTNSTERGWDYARSISKTGCNITANSGNPRVFAIGW